MKIWFPTAGNLRLSPDHVIEATVSRKGQRMTVQIGSQNYNSPGGHRKLAFGSRIAAGLTGTSLDELAAAPDDEDKTVRLAGLSLILISLLSMLGWWVGLGIARGSFAAVHLPWAVLAGMIIFTIDRAMLRWLWSHAGRKLAKAIGFAAEAGETLLVRAMHLLLRVAVTLIVSLTLASFLDIALFQADTSRHLEGQTRELNAPLVTAAAERIDGLIAAKRDEIDRLDSEAAAVIADARQATVVQQTAAAAQLEALATERGTLLARLDEVNRALSCYEQDAVAERRGQARCDGAETVRGEGDAYTFANEMAALKQAERQSIDARIAEIDAALQRLGAGDADAGLPAAVQTTLNPIAAERARVAGELADLVEDRERAIHESLATDPSFVPFPEGLIAHGEALDELTSQSPWLAMRIRLVFLCMVILDLGAVLVMSMMPAPRTIVLGEFLTAQVRMHQKMATSEQAIADAMEQTLEARARKATAEHATDERVTRLRSDTLMRRAANDHVDANIEKFLRRAG